MSQVEEDFRVELNIFRGPLDLLLYLVRKHELEVADIPIAEVLDQYLEFLDIMEQLSIDAVGDFLDLASTLTEIKSRLVLPRVEEPLLTLRCLFPVGVLGNTSFSDGDTESPFTDSRGIPITLASYIYI